MGVPEQLDSSGAAGLLGFVQSGNRHEGGEQRYRCCIRRYSAALHMEHVNLVSLGYVSNHAHINLPA